MIPLTIALVTTFYPPYNFGGDGVFVYRLAHALAQRGHRVHVIHNAGAFLALAGEPPTTVYANHSNITLHPLTGGGTADMLLTHQLGRPVAMRHPLKTLLEDSELDIIHFHNVSLLGGPSVLASGNAIKLCTMHDYWFVCAMHVLWRFDREACTRRTCVACTLAGHRPPQLWRYTGSVERAVRYVDAFIAGSAFSCEAHRANGFPAPIHHLPHFLPDSEIQDADAERYEHPRPYFLYVGRLEKLKGVQVLIEVFRRYTAADLVIVGAGSYAPELHAAARDLSHVHFVPWIAHDRLRNLYRRALAVLVPSLCYETFGLVPVEAFAAHTPVIAHRIGALTEMITASGGGLLYTSVTELLAALETLRAQPEQRQALGAHGYQQYLDHYTEAQHLRRYEALIDQLRAAREEKRV